MPHVRERDPNPDELPQDTAKKTGAADPDSSVRRGSAVRRERRDRRRVPRPAAGRLTT